MTAAPRVGIGYRHPIGAWIRTQIDRFDVLEVTVDHYLYGGPHIRAALEDLARRIPVIAHGVGLSLGTDAPLDVGYVREVARVVAILGAPSYSEHLAFTKVAGRDLGNLLPLPKTPAVAEQVAEKVRRVRSLIGVPFDLENISYLFDWPDSAMTDAAFLGAVCVAGGAGILLDVENVHVNAHNHGLDPYAALDAMPAQLVHGFHVAGGVRVGRLLADSHDEVVPDATLDLLRHALTRFRPDTVILERDDKLDAFDEILHDLARIRACLAAPAPSVRDAAATVAPPVSPRPAGHAPLGERQRALVAFLTNPRAEIDGGTASPLAGLDPDRLRLVRALSFGKRLAKVQAALPLTIAHLDEPFEDLAAEFAVAFPPNDIGRYENARQFHDFLEGRWRLVPPRRPYVRDLARIELALAHARTPHRDGAAAAGPRMRPALRRHPAVQLLQCGYDVQPLLDPSAGEHEPRPRDISLAVLPPPPGPEAGESPRVMEVSPQLHAALESLGDWRAFDRTDPLGTGAPPEVAARLLDLGLLELVS